LTAADFFIGVVLALFDDGKPEEINFNSIWSMFNGIDKKLAASDYLTEYFKTKGITAKSYIFASAIFLVPKDTKGGILSVARQKVKVICYKRKIILVS